MDESITCEELQRLRAQSQAPLVIDVRREPAYLASPHMIAGALRRDPAAVAGWARELPPGARLVVYCVHGHEVSQGAARALRALGRDARFLEGGVERWREAGGETFEKPAGARLR